MGASNAIAAFDLYAGLVPPTSLLLLVRMALVSKDSDPEPWFSEGNKALARWALGRGRHAEVEEPDLKAVQRALAPLHKVGAISTIRKPSIRRDGPDTAKYQLHLKTADGGRKVSPVEPPKVDSRGTKTVRREEAQDPQRGTLSGPHGGRKPSGTGDENCPPEETGRRQEEKERTKSGARGIAKVLRFPTGELALVPPPPTENAGTITAAWIDHCKTRNVIMPSDVIARYGKGIKQALDDGFAPDLIKRALAQMLDANEVSWPSSLGRYIVRVQETSAPRSKPSTTDQRVADALALAEQFDRKEIQR